MRYDITPSDIKKFVAVRLLATRSGPAQRGKPAAQGWAPEGRPTIDFCVNPESDGRNLCLGSSGNLMRPEKIRANRFPHLRVAELPHPCTVDEMNHPNAGAYREDLRYEPHR